MLEPAQRVHTDRCTAWITGRVPESTKILFDAVSRARGDPDLSTTVRFMVAEFLAKYVTQKVDETTAPVEALE